MMWTCLFTDFTGNLCCSLCWLFKMFIHLLGINSGVMLMNVTRMLEAKWLDHIIPYYKKHQYDITWGDQDLINIFFHYFPGPFAVL